MRRLLLMAVCGSAIVMGCISTKAVLLDPSAPRYPVEQPDKVRIFTSEEELADYEYVRVAIINSSGNTTWSTQTQMIESIRKKAGEMGANAILMPKIDEPSAGAKVAGAALFGVFSGVSREGEVIAIRIMGKK